MQSEKQSKRYIFQADALGVAGQITHPLHEAVLAQAASVLSPDGGFGAARVEAFRHKGILSFSAAYTEVAGSEPQPGIFESVALSVVENFNLMDVVTCDRIVGRVTTKSTAITSDPVETSIVPIGSRFEGLRVGNEYFPTLELAPDYFCRPDRASWAGLIKGLEDGGERRELQRLSLPVPGGDPASLEGVGPRTGILGFGIALSGAPKDQLGAPMRFAVQQFGTVHLGEYFCYPNTRSLTMLRVELGCPVGGCVTASAVGGGGRSYP